MRKPSLLFFGSIIALLIVAVSVDLSSAQVMQSSNFQIQSDSVNIGGGFSTSSSYRLESTVGEIATGRSTSTNYSLYAGYQQMQEVFISLSGAMNVDLTPNLGAITGGVSNGSTTVTVVTDSPSGYGLTIQAQSSPAMQDGIYSINDYTPAGADPDFNFITNPTDAHFGYSPYGNDVADRFLNDGVDCNTGSNNDFLFCWAGLSTTSQLIAESSSSNHPSGATTTINFRVGLGGDVNQPPGVYTATTTVTAFSL